MAIEMTSESALGIMGSKTMISHPGKYQVKVTNDPQALADKGVIRNPLRGGSTQISIGNINAYNPYQLEQFRKHYHAGNFEEAANQSMNFSIRDCDYMPSKNETLNIIVSNITNKDGIEVLVVTSYSPLPIAKAEKLSIEDLLGKVTGQQQSLSMNSILTKEDEIQPSNIAQATRPF